MSALEWVSLLEDVNILFRDDDDHMVKGFDRRFDSDRLKQCSALSLPQLCNTKHIFETYHN
ncbi:hypothetical protein ABG067_006044 [Albugo candida]